MRKTTYITLALALVLVIFSFVGSCWAATINAASCSQSAVQAAINSANSGDTVSVPAGTCVWASALTMKAGVTLQGTASLATQISSFGQAIDFGGANNCRITGIYFHSTGDGNSNHMIEGHGTGVRVDNNKFDGPVSVHIFFVDPYHSTGVVYNNLFTGSIRGQALYVRGNAEGSAGEFGRPIDFGSSDWVFFEGNTINSTNSEAELLETQNGGKMVSRWNTITGTAWGWVWEQHNCGTHSPGDCYGGRAHEAYNNLIKPASGGSGGGLLYMRDGTGIFYNNVMDYSQGGSEGAYAVTNYRAGGGVNHNDFSEGYDCATGSFQDVAVPSYGTKYLARCCSTAYTNGNLQGEGYPCIGTVHTIFGGTPEPVYFWDNKKTSNGTALVSATNIGPYGLGEEWAIQLNKEYCISSSGKLTSCGGVALNYTPYVCPHPLTGLTGSCSQAIAGTAGYNITSTGSTYGDVSGDGTISAYDASLAAQYAVILITLTPTQITAADVSGDGTVSAYDASLIAQRAVGLINKFPVEP